MGLLLASAMSKLYAFYFNLPETIGGINFQAILLGLVISVGVSLAAGLGASKRVTAIHPAESMHPEPPRRAGKMIFEYLPWLWRRLDPVWKMSLRTINRKRGRFLITLVGVIFAVGLLVMSLFSNDSIDYLIQKHFYQEQHYDLFVRFTVPVKESETLNISRLDGVIKTEPLLEIPVKMHFNGRSEDELLQGLPAYLTLKKLIGDNEKHLKLPEEGILISQRTASKLGARVGDRVEVETLLGLGPTRRTGIKIMGINRQLVGSGSYIEINQANRLLEESGLVSGAMLKVDSGKVKLVEEELNEMTGVSSISSLQKELDNLNQNMDSMIYTISILIAFAVLLGFAIVYNSSVINFAERKRELASLRVTGFTTREVFGLLFKETLLQSLLGVFLGLPFGQMMTEWYVRALSTDLFTMQVVVYPRTYLFSAVGGIFFIMAAHLFTVKGVRQLDLVDVLKEKD
jgi:putative ABC transport system permease protein